MDGGGGHELGRTGDPLGGTVAGVDMSNDRPSVSPQHGDEAAGGFAGIAPALRGPGSTQATSAGPAAGPGTGSVACTVPAAAPVARTRITQLPHSWSPPGERHTARRA